MNIKLQKFIPDVFVIGIVAMIILAYFFPGILVYTKPINLGIIINYGMAFIFFFYGLKLKPQEIKLGIKNWKMHLSIQLITFLVFPILVLLIYPILKGTQHEMLWLSLFFLAALPSTVSSSVVMVSIARGNIVGAVFNASLSGLLGIVLTPLWMSFFLISKDSNFEFSAVLQKLVLQILLPVILGIFLRPLLGRFMDEYRSQMAWFDKSIILLIVYESFSHSFIDGIFKNMSWSILFILGLVVILLFFTVLYLSSKISKYLNFSFKDEITTQFCGTKKSLVHGTVMSNVLFTSSISGVMILPIMIYHAFQLVFIGFLAEKYAEKNSK